MRDIEVKQNEKEENEGSKRGKDKKQKQTSLMDARVSAPRPFASAQQNAVPSHRAKQATRASESTTLMDRIEQETVLGRLSPISCVASSSPSKKGAKQAARASSLTKENHSAPAMSLPPAAEAPSLSKAARSPSLDTTERLKPAEEGFLRNCIGSCDRQLANLSENITPEDRALLQRYVADTKV